MGSHFHSRAHTRPQCCQVRSSTKLQLQGERRGVRSLGAEMIRVEWNRDINTRWRADIERWVGITRIHTHSIRIYVASVSSTSFIWQEGNSLSDRPRRPIFGQVFWIGYLIISQSIAYFDAAGKNNYGGMTQVVLDIWGWIYWSLGQYIKGRSQVYYVCPDRGS